MFKTSAIVAAAGLAFAAGATAGMHNPALDQTLDVPDFQLAGDGSLFSHTVDVAPNNNPVVGFTFTADWFGDGGAWASDMQLTITAPDGESFVAGGFPSPGGENDWDFQGSGSAAPGAYTSTHFPAAWVDGVSKDGIWTFDFLNTFGAATSHDFSNVSITLHKIPTPGAVGLFGIAGLAGARRRR